MDALIGALALPFDRLALCLAIVFGAGILRGYTGFGFALAAVPTLSLVVPPVMVVPLVLCLEVIASVQMLPGLWREIDFRSVFWLGLGSLLGVPLGVWALAALPEAVMRLVIALIVLFSLIAILLGGRFRNRPGAGATLGVGAFSGLLNGAAAMGGPPVILFYIGSQAAAAVGRASLVFYFALIDGVAIALAAGSGLLTRPLLLLAALSIPALALGQVIGNALFRSALQRHYRSVAVVVLGVVGITALARSVLLLAG